LKLIEAKWIEGTLKRRYKRFLADIILENGQEITAHCPNTGAMRGLLEEGRPVWLSDDQSPRRRYRYTWQAIKVDDTWVGMNTHLPNKLMKVALSKKLLEPFKGYEHVKSEVVVAPQVRFDFLLSNDKDKCYLEVKNVHYQEKGVALFPDSRTTRGLKHLEFLCQKVKEGIRAAVVYVVQREGCHLFDFGEAFDPCYAKGAQKALDQGVEMYAYTFSLKENGVFLGPLIPRRSEVVRSEAV